MSDGTFAIGEVADMLGLSPHTIRAWERRHLFARPMRTAAGQRRYTPDDVELLRQIKHGRHALGFSMRVATMAAKGTLVPESHDAAELRHAAADPGRPVDPLRRVVDLVPDMVVLVDPDGRIRHANTAFVRFCDVMAGKLRGHPFADFVDPFDRAKAVQAYRSPLRPRRGWEFGLRTRRRRALFAFDCWPLSSGEGEVLAMIGRQIDAAPPATGPATIEGGAGAGPSRRPPPAPVLALLQGVADPVRTLELLRPWLDGSPLGVVLAAADADLTVLVANAAFRRLAGPDVHPVEGRAWRDMAPAADAERHAAAAREVAVGAQCRTVTGCRPAWDDPGPPPAAVWDVDLSPVVEVGGVVTHVLLTVRDATGEVAAAQRLQALAGLAPDLRQAADARQVLATAARHAPALLRDADALVVSAGTRRGADLELVATEGAWADGERDAEGVLRLALVRDVVRTGTSIEVERAAAARAHDAVLAVPLKTRRPDRVVGALAFSRAGAGPFSALDRLLVEEFAGRVAMALARAELLSGRARLA